MAWWNVWRIVLVHGGSSRAVTRANFDGSLSFSISSITVGTICHDRPNWSFRHDSHELPPILCSMACHRSGASLVACRAEPCGRSVDRPTGNRGAYPAPLASLDPPHAVSRTLQIHSAQPNFARSPARCNRRRGRALLPAPWIRLARDPNRCRRRFGRRSHSRSFQYYAATPKKPILRNGPLHPPQGRRGHTGTAGRIRPRQAAHSRDIPQRGRMALVFMVQSRRVVTTTKPQPGISAGNRRHGWLQFFRLP